MAFAALCLLVAGQTPQQLIAGHLPFGAPSASVEGKTKILVRSGFIVMSDLVRKDPLWVAFHLTKDGVSTNAREGSFKPDPTLPEGSRAELDDYANSGFDRGHMAASGDMRRSVQIQSESFYLSNMCPQNPTLNRGIWAKLEARYRTYATKFGRVYIMVGPVFDKPLPAGMDPLPTSIGPDKVEVPTWFYRIVLRKGTDGHWTALAIEMPNVAVKTKDDLVKYLVPIRQIEKETGLNFASKLPQAEQDRFEKTAARHFGKAHGPPLSRVAPSP